jgi:hypothetical protein
MKLGSTFYSAGVELRKEWETNTARLRGKSAGAKSDAGNLARGSRRVRTTKIGTDVGGEIRQYGKKLH